MFLGVEVGQFKTLIYILSQITSCLLILVGCSDPVNYPDYILVNGKIITMDDRVTIAGAVAIRGDKIVARTMGCCDTRNDEWHAWRESMGKR